MIKKQIFFILALLPLTTCLAVIGSSMVLAATAPFGCYQKLNSGPNGGQYEQLTNDQCAGKPAIPAGNADPTNFCYVEGTDSNSNVTWTIISCDNVAGTGVANPGAVVGGQAAGPTNSAADQQALADNNLVADPTCKPGAFLGIIPPWYEFLPVGRSQVDSHSDAQQTSTNPNHPNGTCEVAASFVNKSTHALSFTPILSVGLAVLDGLLRIAGVVAVGFIIAGGFRYVLSQGEPDNTKQALQSIINACVGLAIALVAAVIVSFIGNKLGG